MKREEQDQLRDTINRLALMSPYRSTVERARAVVERIDDFGKSESDYQQVYEAPSEDDLREWFSQASDDEKRGWLNGRDSSIRALDEAQKGLLDAVYGLRRHLELVVSRPEGDPATAADADAPLST